MFGMQGNWFTVGAIIVASLFDASWRAPGVHAQHVAGLTQAAGSSEASQPELARIRERINLTSFLFENLEDSFSGANLLYPALMLGSTWFMAKGGVDEDVQRFFQRENPLGQDFADGMFLLGMFGQVGVAATMHLVGELGDDSELSVAGAAALQALGVNFVVTHLLKVFSGRPGPEHTDEGFLGVGGGSWARGDANTFEVSLLPVDNIRESRFFWPSGHTSAAFAFAASLTAFYEDVWWVGVASYASAAAIGLGMVEGDYHWASDVVAGALLGHTIGWTIGRKFRRAYDGDVGDGSDWLLIPTVSSNRVELSLVGSM